MRNFIITVDGKKYEVGVEEVGTGESPATPATPKAPQAVPLAASAAPKANPNGTKVLSPFPGLIKSLLLGSGDKVKKDQPILVLEAMKMDNDITSPCDGVITYNVQKGANVESDAVLAVIS